MSYSKKYSDFPKPYTGYDYLSITVSGAVADYDVATHTVFFDKVKVANKVEVTVSGGEVGMRMNSTSNAMLPVSDGETKTITDLSVQNLYFTNAGGTPITVTLLSYGWR